MSRHLWSREDDNRDGARNEGTLFFAGLPGVVDGFLPPGPCFREVFWRHYSAIRVLLNERTKPGLAVIVAGRKGLEATAWLEAKDRGINPLIIGRHAAADVFVPSDPGLSLRHLAVLLYGRRSEPPVRFRVLDLRTPLAFADERGDPLEAVEAEGPLMLRCTSLSLLLFPTGGEREPWPADPARGWLMVPERHYLASESADPDRWFRPGPGGRGPRGQRPRLGDTLVHTFPGPVFSAPAVADGDQPRGEIMVSSPSGRASVRLGRNAARQGLLLGRYERCDTAGLSVLQSPALSRVHLLLIDVEGTLYAVDTASTNGSWWGASQFRSVKVDPGSPLSLAGQAAVEWRPFH